MRPAIWIVLASVLLPACQERGKPIEFVARVGDAILLQSDLNAALEGFYGDLGTSDARAQIIDQWVESELLYQEALRLNLRSKESVRQQLKDAERAVLIDAFIAPLFDESAASLTDADLLSYYDTHKERLRTIEPFVLIRYLETPRRDSARAVQNQMRGAPNDEADLLFDRLALRHSTDPALSHSLASNYWPESRLFTGQPQIRQVVQELSPSTARVFAVDSLHYYVEVVDRVPVGTVPEFEWIKEQVRTHCAIDLRKQLYDRQVQRLRTEALAREVLVIRK